MLDFILGLFLAGLLLRGWLRGMIREVLDLVGLVAGLWIAFSLNGPFGEFLSDRFEVAPEVAGIGAGIALFLLFGISMSVAAHYLSKAMRLPGLSLINRIGGAAVAGIWGIAILLVLVNVARAVGLPDSIEARLGESVVAEAVAGPGALPQQAFERLDTTKVLSSVASLQTLLGGPRVVPEGDEVISIPPAQGDEVRQLRGDAQGVLAWVNDFRAGEELGALAASEAVTTVAEDRAVRMYTGGRLSRETPPGGSVADDLDAAGVLLTSTGENMALASSARAAFDGMTESTTGLAQLRVSGYDRAGISVVEGPTGVLVVIVLGG